MNTATQNLENDHVHILRLTDVMLAMVLKQSVDTIHFELVINLIRNFADGLHHAKEENFFFRCWVKKAFRLNQGPVAVMLNEHEEGKRLCKRCKPGYSMNLKKVTQRHFNRFMII